MSEEQKSEIKKSIKAGLEGLNGKIEGTIDIKVNINGLPTSNVDVMLDSSFVDYDALKVYASHPDHLAVANGIIRPVTAQRCCLDFEE